MSGATAVVLSGGFFLLNPVVIKLFMEWRAAFVKCLLFNPWIHDSQLIFRDHHLTTRDHHLIIRDHQLITVTIS
jgi:hypothetical protein